ncbi:diphosphomevalonate decarboxylase [Candidatus Microgenomates bacterium]|nr:diphosphomevalonate decarboxylase [Candidatus Microgenomates bacterium]
MKKTAVAPSNIAFIKYWGRKDEELRLPENGSISMCLSRLTTTSTVEFNESFLKDEIVINGTIEEREASRVVKHLDRVRKIAGIPLFAKVVAANNFPTGTGLSSSASGFAALTLAACAATGITMNEQELSILARQGSGSACRSIPSGFVEWLDGDTSESSYAHSLYPPGYWDIADIVAIVSEGRKDVATSQGMKLFGTSPFSEARKSGIPQKIVEIKDALSKKDFTKFGEISEAEALNMHAVMLTSCPSLIYWTPGTLRLMKLVKQWRTEGVEVYFTINTGQDIHLLVQGADVHKISEKLKELEFVKETIVNKPSAGAQLITEDLF